MSNKEYIVKVYHYIDGLLEKTEHEFEKLEAAIEHGLSAACHTYKVYDKHGNICHEGNGHHGHHSYA